MAEGAQIMEEAETDGKDTALETKALKVGGEMAGFRGGEQDARRKIRMTPRF